MKVIHQTVMAVIRTVNYRWLLRTGPRCRTAESARANHKFKGAPGSCTVRSPWISYMPIQIPWLRVRRAMLKMRTVEDRITKINTRLQGLFGAQFEILFGKLHGNVMYFVIFCNLINILDVGADSSDPATSQSYGSDGAPKIALPVRPCSFWLLGAVCRRPVRARWLH